MKHILQTAILFVVIQFTAMILTATEYRSDDTIIRQIVKVELLFIDNVSSDTKWDNYMFIENNPVWKIKLKVISCFEDGRLVDLSEQWNLALRHPYPILGANPQAGSQLMLLVKRDPVHYRITHIERAPPQLLVELEKQFEVKFD